MLPARLSFTSPDGRLAGRILGKAAQAVGILSEAKAMPQLPCNRA